MQWGGRRQGKSEMERRALDAMLDAGKTVVVFAQSGVTRRRRVHRNGRKLDVITPFETGLQATWVSVGELGKLGIPDVPDKS